MPKFRRKEKQVNAVQWTGSNLSDVQAFLGFTPKLKAGGWLILPGGGVVVQNDWIVIGEYRNIYTLPDAEFTGAFTEEKPSNPNKP